MLTLLQNYQLMPFHFSLFILLLLGVAHCVMSTFKLRYPRTVQRGMLHPWLRLNWIKVKFSRLVLLIFLLLNFSMAGYVLQFLLYAQHQHFVSPLYLLIPAAIIAVCFTIFMSHCLSQVIQPKVQIRSNNLLGRLATLRETARPGFPATAYVRDALGTLHQIQVAPEFGELDAGSCVMLIRDKKSYYLVKRMALSSQLFSKSS